MSAQLHAMMSLTTPQFQIQPAGFRTPCSSDEEPVPVTSQWKALRKRKVSIMTMAGTPFDKHVYGRERKRSMTPLEDFDPRPLQFRGTVHVIICLVF